MIKNNDMSTFSDEKKLKITKLRISKEDLNSCMTIAAKKIITLIITAKRLNKINILHA